MKRQFYIGTYTEGPQYFPREDALRSRGIYSVFFDTETGRFSGLRSAAETSSPSWLASHPSLPILYAIGEAAVPGFQGGALNVFRSDRKAGTLEFLGRFDTVGRSPCHIAVHPEGRFLVVSNYRSGNFAAFLLDEDGRVGDGPFLFQGEGNGPNAKRQDGPHAHFVCFDPSDRSMLMIDLGSDTIYRRRFDPDGRRFETPKGLPDLKVPPGFGCRHGVFSKDGSRFYVVNELNFSLSIFVRQESGGPLESIEMISFLKSDEESPQTGAAIDLSPSGKTLLLSARNPGSVSLFSLDDRGGVTLSHQIATTCRIPRFCRFSHDGKHVFICGQDTGAIEVFSLTDGQKTDSPLVESPVCMV